MRPAGSRTQLFALAALFAGALAIGGAGIFVRLSETGPIATGFWRGALALPFLAGWAALEERARRRAGHPRPGWNSRFAWGGFFFAGDMAFWNWSLVLTSVAAATLEANLVPIVVTLIAWIAWRERPQWRFVAALGLALLGVFLIVSPKLGGGSRALLGDFFGIATAIFYGAYIVVVARLRSVVGTGLVMFRTTLVFTALLLPLALLEKFLPDTAHGWALLIGLALSAQFLGQGLIAYALAHLPAAFSSVALYVQPIAAAVYAWLLLGERLQPIQIAGGLVTLVAIALAGASSRPVPQAGVQPVEGRTP